MKTKAFTVIEMMIVITVIAISAAIFGAAFGRAKESSKQKSCASNLHQIGLAVVMYAGDNDGYAPPVMTQPYENLQHQKIDGDPEKWRDELLTYTKSKQVFFCPDNPHPGLATPNPGADSQNSLYTSYTTDLMMGDFGANNSLSLNIDAPIKANIPYAQDRVFFIPNENANSNAGFDISTFHGDIRNVVYLDCHTVAVKLGENNN